MGVSGALVWCRSDDGWIPLKLESIKLSGALTKAHWDFVTELVKLIATNQVILQDGKLHNASDCDSAVPESLEASESACPLSLRSVPSCGSELSEEDRWESGNDDSDSWNLEDFECSDRGEQSDADARSAKSEAAASEASLSDTSTSSGQWETLLRQHSKSKKVEKQLQKQRAVWARNKRKLKSASLDDAQAGGSIDGNRKVSDEKRNDENPFEQTAEPGE
ncbi:unnamed protein product [Bemisia tabaci]|uniref:Uncharacterized protein n=1 Tax=Bemisia tabaci TaxID=7038 RepID=A0A9P0A340_BEMTA|nr:unnamed protein product [Bemisia tabaci]